MTDQEIQEIQEQAEKWCQENIDKHGFCDNVELAFTAGAKWMQERDEWISVETPPTTNGEYLICDENDNIQVTYYDLLTWGYLASIRVSVKSWQPLPSPPKTK